MFYDEFTGEYSFFPPTVSFQKDGDLWHEFREFHQQNPEVYQTFKEKILSSLGRRRLTSYEVREKMITCNKHESVDNNLAPYYLRTFLEEFPQYSKFFRLKCLKSGNL